MLAITLNGSALHSESYLFPLTLSGPIGVSMINGKTVQPFIMIRMSQLRSVQISSQFRKTSRCEELGSRTFRSALTSFQKSQQLGPTSLSSHEPLYREGQGYARRSPSSLATGCCLLQGPVTWTIILPCSVILHLLPNLFFSCIWPEW